MMPTLISRLLFDLLGWDSWQWFEELYDFLIDIASEFLLDGPQAAFLMLIVIGALFLLEFLANQNVAIDPENSEQRSFLQKFGRIMLLLIGMFSRLLAVTLVLMCFCHYTGLLG